jgi:SAM-dependent methyltransferase
MTATSAWPDVLFDRAAKPGRISLVTPEGFRRHVDPSRWHTLSHADRDVLGRAVAPVLDVGCGPGRHVGELTKRGKEALGLDSSTAAVREATRRGAPVVHGSVFGAVPGAGGWGTLLLLDGNIGIAGNPERLLKRCGDLLRPGGRVLVETEPPGRTASRGRVRVEDTGPLQRELGGRSRRTSPWFSWATVSASHVHDLAAATGFAVREIWRAEQRWFADLSLIELQAGR